MRKACLLLVAAAVAFGASGAHAQPSVSPSAARDARVLHRELAAHHPNLYRHVSKARFRAEVDRLVARAPQLSANELVATEYVVRGAPNDRRLAVVPDVRVHLTSTDYFAGRDPVLARALQGL